jgi:hypothetical protein
MLTEHADELFALPADGGVDFVMTRRKKMAQISDDTLRSLIRLIPPTRALKDDLERSLTMETFMGTGDMAVRSFQGLQASVAGITSDPYVANLSIEVPANANDQEKVSLVRLAAGQLLAYLEGQTGLSGSSGSYGSGGHGGNINIQKAPSISFNDIQGVDSETLSRMVSMAEKALTKKGEEEGEPPSA